jgi:hypothetical protein
MNGRALGRTSLFVFAALGLTACGGASGGASGGDGDWRSQTIERAETQMRAAVSDPTAQFWRVQVTGDDQSGQTCGFITKKNSPDGPGGTERFIVYIDQSAGPYIEGTLGKQVMSEEAFSRAWENDCISDGLQFVVGS